MVGYNYMDMSYINTNGAWIETGINASHARHGINASRAKLASATPNAIPRRRASSGRGANANRPSRYRYSSRVPSTRAQQIS